MRTVPKAHHFLSPTSFTMMLSSQVLSSLRPWRIDLTCSRAIRSLGGEKTHNTPTYKFKCVCSLNIKSADRCFPTSLFVTGIWFGIFQVFLKRRWRFLWTTNLGWLNPLMSDGQLHPDTSHRPAFQTWTETHTICWNSYICTTTPMLQVL